MTNAEVVKDDLVLVTLNDEEGLAKLMTIDTASEAVELILDQDDYSNSYDLDKVPSSDEDH